MSRYDEFCPENIKAIQDFLTHYASTGKKQTSVNTAEDNLVTMFKNIGAKKSFKTITNHDIDNALQKCGWKLSAQETLKRTMRQFLIYHKRKKIADGIILNSKVCKKILSRDELPTPDEIDKLRNCYNEIMNRAVVEVFLISGGRNGETQSLNVGGVRFEGDIIWFDFRKSKTEIRSVPIIPNDKNPLAFYPKNVEAWLRVHPMRDNKDAPFFLSRSVEPKYYNQRISEQGIQRLMRRARKLSGIKKRIYAHLLRHTCATYDGEYLSEQMMNVKYGWKQGSTMARTYCHVDRNNLVKVLREHAGIKQGEPQGKKCPRCGEQHNQNTESCTRCGMILDTKKLMEEVEKKQQLEARMETLEKSMKILNSYYGNAMMHAGYHSKEVPTKYQEFQRSVNKIIENAVARGISQEKLNSYKEMIERLLA